MKLKIENYQLKIAMGEAGIHDLQTSFSISSTCPNDLLLFPFVATGMGSQELLSIFIEEAESMARRSERQRRARAMVIWSIAAFFLVQWGIGLAVDSALPQVRDPEYVHREQLLRAKAAAEPHTPLVVVLGSSRILNGLDAKMATELLEGKGQVFNFGIPSSGPVLQRVWLERLRRNGVRPDWLVIEVLPAFFNERQTRDQNDLDGARLSAGELSQVRPTLVSLAGPIRRWTVGRALPCYRHQAELHGLLPIDQRRGGDELPNDLKTVDAFGWQPRNYAPEQCSGLTRLAHRQYDGCYRDFRLSEDQERHLDAVLARCRDDGIRAALLLTPEGKEFRQLYSPEMSAAIDGMLARLRDKYGVSVIDARDWLDDSNFYDMHHLLYPGGREFSRRFATERIAPLLARDGAIARGNDEPHGQRTCLTQPFSGSTRTTAESPP